MQVDFNHGIYKDRPAFFGSLLPIDAESYASTQASIDAFYASLRQASAGQREAMLASAIASLESGAGRGADAAYHQALASGASEDAAKAAAQKVIQGVKAQEAAYRQAVLDVANQEDATRASAITTRTLEARALLNKSYNVLSPDYPDPKPPSGLSMLLLVGAAYLALKG